ncbi:MAG: hypothetical protein ACI8Y7_001082 [Candidatus Woesearchaeota archaeon]|jgi:hypothetical protein
MNDLGDMVRLLNNKFLGERPRHSLKQANNGPKGATYVRRDQRCPSCPYGLPEEKTKYFSYPVKTEHL